MERCSNIKYMTSKSTSLELVKMIKKYFQKKNKFILTFYYKNKPYKMTDTKELVLDIFTNIHKL